MTRFKEKQRLNVWWAWMILFIAIGFVFFAFSYLIDPKFGIIDTNNLYTLIPILVVPTLIIIALLIIHFELRIDDKKISIRTFPFYSEDIKLNNIKYAEIVDLRKFKSQGVQAIKQYGKDFTSRTKKALKVKLKSGPSLFIQTNKPQKLNNVIQKLAIK